MDNLPEIKSPTDIFSERIFIEIFRGKPVNIKHLKLTKGKSDIYYFDKNENYKITIEIAKENQKIINSLVSSNYFLNHFRTIHKKRFNGYIERKSLSTFNDNIIFDYLKRNNYPFLYFPDRGIFNGELWIATGDYEISVVPTYAEIISFHAIEYDTNSSFISLYEANNYLTAGLSSGEFIPEETEGNFSKNYLSETEAFFDYFWFMFLESQIVTNEEKYFKNSEITVDIL